MPILKLLSNAHARTCQRDIIQWRKYLNTSMHKCHHTILYVSVRVLAGDWSAVIVNDVGDSRTNKQTGNLDPTGGAPLGSRSLGGPRLVLVSPSWFTVTVLPRSSQSIEQLWGTSQFYSLSLGTSIFLDSVIFWKISVFPYFCYLHSVTGFNSHDLAGVARRPAHDVDDLGEEGEHAAQQQDAVDHKGRLELVERPTRRRAGLLREARRREGYTV